MTYIDLPLSGGVFQYRRVVVNSNYIVTSGDNYIGCDANAGNITLSLPPANTVNNGRCFVIKDEGGTCINNLKRVFISPSGADKIDGTGANLSLTANYESITLVCNGVNEWFVI